MKKTNLILLLILSVTTSCLRLPEKKKDKGVPNIVDRDSYTFSHPGDWEVTEEELVEEGAYYMSIEKKGFESSGLMTITAFDYDIDLDALVNLNLEELQSNKLFRNFTASQITEDTFNTVTAKSATYHFRIIGMDHEGEIIVFQHQGKTYSILKQGANEDEKDNEEGFAMIEGSFVPK